MLHMWIYDAMRSDNQYQEGLANGHIDIDVSCKTRDQLPETVDGPLLKSAK